MSEYQYYEFLAIDCPLDAAQMAALRALSTRAEITSTRFTKTSLKGMTTVRSTSAGSMPLGSTTLNAIVR